MLNTIAGGFAGGGETSSTRKRYARTVWHVDQKVISESDDNMDAVTFSKKDAAGVLPHENDPMVIKVQIRDWSVKRVLIDPGSSADILYWAAFRGMGLDLAELLPFKGSLVGFSREHVQVLGHLAFPTTFGSTDNARTVRVRYLIINAASPYNIIVGRPSLNALEASLSTLYLTMIFHLVMVGLVLLRVTRGWLGNATETV